MLTVSVVIPALNEQQNIRRAVRGAWDAKANEVIVVDGGSLDRTCEFARDERAIVTTCQPGRANQQNAGAAVATGQLLLFQHADCWLGTHAIEQIRERMADTKTTFGGFRQRIDNPRRIYRWIERGNAFRYSCLKMLYGDQGIFVRRDVFQQCNGFADVRLMEDVILSRSLRKTGRSALLPGPLYVSDRRWEHFGVGFQTMRNWLLIVAYSVGVPPNRLAAFYPRHDE